MADLTDIESITKDYSWNKFLEIVENKSKYKYKDVRVDIDWTRTKFVASDPNFNSIGNGHVSGKPMKGKIPPQLIEIPKAQEIYRSVYVNRTEGEQEHSISMQRSTKSICKAYVNKGYTKGINVGLKLAVPGEVANATANFGYSVNVTDNSEESTEQTMTWGSDCKVKVPRNKQVSAKISITEKEYNASFQMKTTIYGTVHIAIHSRLDDKFLFSLDAPFVEIMRWYCHKEGAFRDCTIKDKEVDWDVSGNCYFRFGVEQTVEIQPSL